VTIREIILFPLGTCSADQNKYQYYSSYLLVVETLKDSYQFLLDAGSKRVSDLCWIEPNKLKMVLISHFHMDHTLYLNKLMKLLNQSSENSYTTIVMHEKTWDILNRVMKVLDLKGNAIKFMKLRRKPKTYDNLKIMKIELPIREKLTDNLNKPIEIPLITFNKENACEFSLKISVINAIHSKECVAYRLEFYEKGEKRLLYFVHSPDTRYNSEYLIDFAKESDYWLLDTTFKTEYVEKYKDNIRKKHSCPKYSALLCERAKVKNYLVGHYFWKRFAKKYEDAAQNIKNEVEKYFTGTIQVLEDLCPIVLYRHDSE
jgi:ribonuclease BN (tRNA processing enzyme)